MWNIDFIYWSTVYLESVKMLNSVNAPEEENMSSETYTWLPVWDTSKILIKSKSTQPLVCQLNMLDEMSSN